MLNIMDYHRYKHLGEERFLTYWMFSEQSVQNFKV